MMSPSTVSAEQRDHHRQHPRHDQVADRIDGQRPQPVELLGHGHGAQLGGVVGADPTAEHQRDEDRPDLAEHRVAGAPADQPGGVEALHEDAGLDDHERAGEERGEGDDRQRSVAHLVQVAQQLAPVEGRRHQRAQHLGQQDGDAAGVAGDVDRPGPDRADEAAADHSGPSSSPRTNWRTTGSTASRMSAAGPR
jgi:hypothetical protein